MKAIILCAGYGTRLYPLTKNKAKPLLKIKGKTILDRILVKIPPIKEVIVTTNRKFFPQFLKWREGKEKIITIFANSSNNEKEVISVLHDVSDIIFLEKMNEDLLVIAGDNLTDVDFRKFIEFAREKKRICVVSFEVKTKEEAKRFGVIELHGDRVVGFEEKPKNPKTRIISSAIYYFPKSFLKTIAKISKSARKEDGIGHLFVELAKKKDVRTFVSKDRFFDIGVIEDYKKANKVW